MSRLLVKVTDLTHVNEEDVWVYISKKSEVSYTELVRAFVDSKRCAKQTLINYKKYLEKEGKIEKRLSETTGRPVYYVPSEKKMEVKAIEGEKDFLDELHSLSPEQRVDHVENLRKDLTRYKRRVRIAELENEPLPLIAVAKKLRRIQEKLGWKVIIDRAKVRPNPVRILIHTGQEAELAWTSRGAKSEKPSDIELKIVSLDEYTNTYAHNHWKLLFQWKMKHGRKAIIAAAYKELLRLDAEEIEDELESWKKEYGLTEKNWRRIRPAIRRSMKQGFLDEEIDHFISLYKKGKTPKADEPRSNKPKSP